MTNKPTRIIGLPQNGEGEEDSRFFPVVKRVENSSVSGTRMILW
jgi:hypothetical protein